jgi:transposase
MDKMSEREWKRLDGVTQVEQGLLSNAEAAALLELSARQLRRVRARVAEVGARGVLHGNRGRAPAHRVAEEIRTRVIALH